MPEIITDMPEAEYHLRPEVSKHDLDMIRRAPLFYRYKKDNPDPPDDEMNFGSLVHLALLQPHLLEQSVCFLPSDMPKDLRRFRNAKKQSDETLESIARWDEFTGANEGKKIITEAAMEKVIGMQASIMANPATAIYFEGDQLREASLFWERSGTRMEKGKRVPFTVKCRARLDILSAVEIADLKTCGDASRAGFMKEMGKRRYSHQGEHYLDGAKACGYPVQSFTMIAVESNPPFLCAAHTLGESSIDIARTENLHDLGIYAKCVETGVWPNIKNHTQPLEAPLWSFEE